MGTRRKGRVLAFQSLYAHDLAGTDAAALLDFSWLDPGRQRRYNDESLAFARLLIQGTLENLTAIDKAITDQLEHWKLSRLNRVDLAILRVSAYCLLYQEAIPSSVTIDEAVDMAKEFGTDESYRFINGVLDGLRKKIKR